jgi:hypothetical protein
MTIDEFNAKLSTAIKKYPDWAEQELKKAARKLKQEIQKNSPDSGSNHKNKIKNSWTYQIKGWRELTEADIRSKAPHFHLIERGHVIKDRYGNVHGFKQGTHFLQKTVKQNGGRLTYIAADELIRKVDKTLEQ